MTHAAENFSQFPWGRVAFMNTKLVFEHDGSNVRVAIQFGGDTWIIPDLLQKLIFDAQRDAIEEIQADIRKAIGLNET